jgi:plastocyanin
MKRFTRVPALAFVVLLTSLTTGARLTNPSPPKTFNVQLLGDAKGMRFEPASIAIRPGDTVVWTNVSGFPHNIAFWADSVPAAGRAKLEANMPKTTAPLMGPMMLAANETYTVAFAGAAPGVYKYNCMPHLALGMVGQITVKP